MGRHRRDFGALRGSTKPTKFRGAVVDTQNSLSSPLTPEFDGIEQADLAVNELLMRGNHWHVQVVVESSFTGPSGATTWNLQRCMNYPRKTRPLPEYVGEGI